MEQILILGHMILAMLLGGFIGYDRETRDKPAGLRTHMLVAGAAALLVGLGNTIVSEIGNLGVTEAIRSDPLRILEAVVTGVSFLGAGTILRQQNGDKVSGLTTAASMLFAAGVGASIGFGEFALGIGSTLLALLTLRTLGPLSYRLSGRASEEPPDQE